MRKIKPKADNLKMRPCWCPDCKGKERLSLGPGDRYCEKGKANLSNQTLNGGIRVHCGLDTRHLGTR